MKIMTVITGMSTGGAERVMATLCNELSAVHQVRLLSMRAEDSDYELAGRVQFVKGNIRNRSGVKALMFVRDQIDEYKPDVVLAFMTKANLISLMAKMLAKHKPKVVIAERSNPNTHARVMKCIRRFVYPTADGMVFQTKQAQDYYTYMRRKNTIVLRNPLNPDFNVKPYAGARRKAIVTMGRLYAEKNQRLLIDSFARIASDFPEYTVEIYGDGPERANLEARIAELGLDGRVKLMGRRDNIRQYVQDASLFVLPSNSEGMPNALIEAMAMGIPSIATDCPIGGSAVVVQDRQNGVLLPMNDAEKMSAAMREILSDGQLAEKLSRNAAKVSEDFSAKTVCALWEDYLVGVARNRRGNDT